MNAQASIKDVTPSADSIVEAIRTIMGGNPTSSLLFGAPAISLRQLESNLQISPATLLATDVLPAAESYAQHTFGNSKHAQLKSLRRGGEQEEWFVFRPSLPSLDLRFPPVPSRSDENKSVPERPDADLQKMKNEGRISSKRTFLRPFFKSETQSLLIDTKVDVADIKLPPAYKIHSAEIGVEPLVPIVLPLLVLPIKTKSALPHMIDLKTPKETYTSVNIDPKSVNPAKVHYPALTYPADNHTPDRQEPMDRDSSLPYLRDLPIPIVNLDLIAKSPTPKSKVSLEYENNPSDPLVDDVISEADPLSPTYSIMTPLSSPLSPSSPSYAKLDIPLNGIPKIDMADDSSIIEPVWSSAVFQDLPFGPDVPAFLVLGWAKDRWQILCAEMVVILGAVYIIQILGI